MAKQYISNKDESVRMFKSDILDFFTRIHYLVPVAIYLPVIILCFYLSVHSFDLTFLRIILLVALGIFIWTLAEYLLHRFIFHYQPTSEFGKKIHFIMHGVHHDYPSDSKRLVFVPSLSIPLALFFYGLFYFILGNHLVYPFFAGFLIGYLVYDETHYALHHFNFKNKFWLNLKHHHMIHHYKDSEHGFGVSSKMWDYVFRTTFKKDSGE
jgi:sterol desaturase/sphingolipid hydroxylase (fatty acid hydroxylase superfamily)